MSICRGTGHVKCGRTDEALEVYRKARFPSYGDPVTWGLSKIYSKLFLNIDASLVAEVTDIVLADRYCTDARAKLLVGLCEYPEFKSFFTIENLHKAEPYSHCKGIDLSLIHI